MDRNLVQKHVYLDHSATTAIHPQVSKVIKRYLKKPYANPSSAHESGLIAKASIELARESIAKSLNCRSNQL
ncbi:MAG TPA: cysteine desulfurase NifS, partial [Clostridiales bacterium UBA8960]|nr:cysteine desulfurase NifS [Clostridiales bacterium UBA8960]